MKKGRFLDVEILSIDKNVQIKKKILFFPVDFSLFEFDFAFQINIELNKTIIIFDCFLNFNTFLLLKFTFNF